MLGGILATVIFSHTVYVAKAAAKDQTPPVISGLHVESITQNSAVVAWITDEPAETDIDYGVAPKLNQHGTRDRTLVVTHAIGLIGLVSNTAYDFCALSRDANQNRAEACGNFTTAMEPPPPSTKPVINSFTASPQDIQDGESTTLSWSVTNAATISIDQGVGTVAGTSKIVSPTATTTYTLSATNAVGTVSAQTTVGVSVAPSPPTPQTSSGGGGGGARPTLASVTGFAYPEAKVTVALRGLPFGSLIEQETTAAKDGSFTASFTKFPQGFYVFTVSATDRNGNSSAVKGFQFDFSSGDAPLLKDAVVIPPTISLARDAIARGDNIAVSGYAQPLQQVLIDIGGIGYEATSDAQGAYQALINTARFAPGKISVRARLSSSERDFSLSKTLILTATTVPEADINKDGIVNIADLSAFLAHPVDINGDGKVNAMDVSVFLRAFGPNGR